jgi:uncharacterized protein (TIRG00374 family)
LKNISLKQLLQYAFFLAVAVALFYLVIKNLNWEQFKDRLHEVNYFWVGISIVCALLSHLARAHRWTLMLKPLGHNARVYPTFLAVMIGYVSNLIFPRFGEVARCGIVSRKENVPMSHALGSVLAERALDLVFMLLVVAAALLFEFPRLKGFLEELFADGSKFDNTALWLILGLAPVFGLASVYIFYRIWHPKLKNHSWYAKFLSLLTDVKDGLLSIGRVKEQGWFWFDSVFIWLMYYAMTYVIVFTLPETSGISLLAGISILAMGSIGMAAPVQGGIGTYHFLVTGTLLVYGASETDAVFLAVLLHATQTIMVVVVGLVSLVLSSRIPSLRNEEPATQA